MWSQHLVLWGLQLSCSQSRSLWALHKCSPATPHPTPTLPEAHHPGMENVPKGLGPQTWRCPLESSASRILRRILHSLTRHSRPFPVVPAVITTSFVPFFPTPSSLAHLISQCHGRLTWCQWCYATPLGFCCFLQMKCLPHYRALTQSFKKPNSNGSSGSNSTFFELHVWAKKMNKP